MSLFTRTQKYLLSIVALGFAGSIALLFTSVPFWIAGLLCSAAFGLNLKLIFDVSKEKQS